MFLKDRKAIPLRVGQRVRVKPGIRSPYSGHAGVLIGISLNDGYGTHLVGFNDRIQFRYTPDELKVLPDELGISAGNPLAS